jgi:N-acetylmuramoyl-L-alanine amidase
VSGAAVRVLHAQSSLSQVNVPTDLLRVALTLASSGITEADCYHRAVSEPPAPRGFVSRRDALRLAGVAPAMLSIGALLDAPRAAAGIAGMAVFLDPGHNAVNDSSTTQQVPNGRGGTKQCNTSGTATDDGYPEHVFTWAVVGLINDSLTQMGVHTALSRDNDNSAGPCVNQRAALANAMHPDAIVSIHADGGPPSGHGFHVNFSSPPLNDAQAGPAVQLAHTMRDALVAAGFQPSTYIGSDGLYGRDDLAGLNLAQYPAVLVELGNMKNADEAAQMESPHGRAKYAAAVTTGIKAYLSAKAG